MKDNFVCVKSHVFGSCVTCETHDHGNCYYAKVFKHKGKPDYNPCPICLHKRTPEECKECLHNKNQNKK